MIIVFRFQYLLPLLKRSIFSIVLGSSLTDINFKFSILRIVWGFYLKVAVIAFKAVTKAYNTILANVIEGAYITIEVMNFALH